MKSTVARDRVRHADHQDIVVSPGRATFIDEGRAERVLKLGATNGYFNVVRVQDAGLQSADDPMVLAWAAAEDRVLASHDVATLTTFAYERVKAGESITPPGLPLP